MTDSQLLSTFVAPPSPSSQNARDEAFANLVQRHIQLVYAAARRQTRDPSLADDITQAVFMILAKKAHTVRDPAQLPSWLISTTRYAALNARKLESRRRLHEQKVAAMNPSHEDPFADLDAQSDTTQIASVLDAGLARLRPRDRSALILRYLRGLSMDDVAQQLNLSTAAAQKRVARGIARLRDVLAHRGIHSSADALESTLTTQTACAVPATLAPLVLSQLTLAAPAPGTAAAFIATKTIKSIVLAKTKLVASLCATAATVAIASGVAIVASTAPLQAQSQASAPTTQAPAPPAPASPTPPLNNSTTPLPPATSQPDSTIKIANITFFENWNQDLFQVGIDPSTKREGGTGAPAVIIQSTTKEWGKNGSALRTIPTLSLIGHRIRFSAWLKTENLANWAGLRLLAGDTAGRVYAHDDISGDYPLVGTNDWTRREIVCDIPEGCTILRIGMSQYGAGKMWMDDAQIEIVGNDVPTTDDSRMHFWSFSRKLYDTRMDEATQRDGHPTRLMFSSTAQNGFWFAYDQNDRHPEKYHGKKVKMSAWLKTEGVTVPSGITVRIMGPNFQSLTTTPSVRSGIAGTRDWKKVEVTFTVPENCQDLCTGVRLCGKGKLWVDDIKYEIVE